MKVFAFVIAVALSLNAVAFADSAESKDEARLKRLKIELRKENAELKSLKGQRDAFGLEANNAAAGEFNQNNALATYWKVIDEINALNGKREKTLSRIHSTEKRIAEDQHLMGLIEQAVQQDEAVSKAKGKAPADELDSILGPTNDGAIGAGVGSAAAI